MNTRGKGEEGERGSVSPRKSSSRKRSFRGSKIAGNGHRFRTVSDKRGALFALRAKIRLCPVRDGLAAEEIWRRPSLLLEVLRENAGNAILYSQRKDCACLALHCEKERTEGTF